MAKQPRAIPDFRSEGEELRFWDQHDPTEFDAGPADIIVQLKRRPTDAHDGRAALPRRPQGAEA
jgi:hypothetical protein